MALPADWQRRLRRAASLADPAACRAFSELMAQVTGKEPDPVLEALLAAMRRPQDHGVYEGLYNAIDRFPGPRRARVIAARLPALLRRLRADDRLVTVLLSAIDGSRTSFLRACRALPARDLALVKKALFAWHQAEPEVEELLTLFQALGGKLPAEPPPGPEPPPPASWPAAHKMALEQLRGDPDYRLWRNGTSAEVALFAALMSQPLGRARKRADDLCFVMFKGFALRRIPELALLVRRQPPAERKRLLQQIGPVHARTLQRVMASSG